MQMLFTQFHWPDVQGEQSLVEPPHSSLSHGERATTCLIVAAMQKNTNCFHDKLLNTCP